jgi:hypothetical protein
MSTIESRCIGDEKYHDEPIAVSSQVTHVLKTRLLRKEEHIVFENHI